MLDNRDLPNTADNGFPTTYSPTPPTKDATIREVRKVKWWAHIGVDAMIVVLVPVYEFVFQMDNLYVALNAVLGILLAAGVIEVAFTRILKMRLDAEQAMWDSEQRARLILASSLDAVIQVAERGEIIAWGPQAEALFGISEADAVGKRIVPTIVPERLYDEYRAVIRDYVRENPDELPQKRIEFIARKQDGTEFPVELAISAVQWKGATTYTSFIRDITERKRAEEALQERTTHDALTGALNHGAIVEALRESAAPEDAFHSIAMVDVDGLKATNDTYGHAMGDAVLQAVATGLQDDELEAVVGRYGGDEFVVLLPNADQEQATAYRDRMMTKFDGLTIAGKDGTLRIPVCISMGIASYPEDADEIADVLSLADSAMYSSREQRHGSSFRRRRVLGKERAARLVSEIVPLLTRTGSREDKLAMVAQHLSAGAGYDGVNFEVVGDNEPPEWQSAHVRGTPKGIVEAWLHEEKQAENHPLGRALAETRRPLFLDDVATDEHLTPGERELLSGAGFKSGLAVPMIWQERVVGILSVGSKTEKFHSWDAQFLTAVASQVTAIVFMTTLVEELQEAADNIKAAHGETVMLLASVAEANDNTTGRHLQRVRELTEALALELDYSEEEARDMGLAAVLHDIGKIQVPDAILNNPGSLSSEEWEVMRKHTLWGAEFLRGHRGFDLAELVAHFHHERWDGTGYPSGLKGDQIPEAAAITCVADTFDAITNDRPYRAGSSADEAVHEIGLHAGTQFSPRVVAALQRLQERRLLPGDPRPKSREQAAA